MALLNDCGRAAHGRSRPRTRRRGRDALASSLKTRALTTLVVLVSCAGLTTPTFGYVAGRPLSPGKQQNVARPPAHANGQAARAEPDPEGPLLHLAAGATMQPAPGPSDDMVEPGRNRLALERRLAAQERQLEEIARRRAHMDAQIAQLRRIKAEAEDHLNGLPSGRTMLEERAQLAAARLADLVREREQAVRDEDRLRSGIAQVESRLSTLAEERRAVRVDLKQRMAGGVEALQQLFAGTSFDLEILMERAAGAEGSGLGGPLEGLDGMTEQEVLHHANDAMAERVRELSALQKVASSLPLASPLDGFAITSGFGKRHDPFTRGLAFHPGLDFGAAAGSRIMATAPGRVVHAGPSGPYGHLVEIDHGMGVMTRYGHLRKVLVEEGEEVDVGQPIGVIGSTGRSTGRHLHYEIRIDEIAFDPARFLEAGRYLVDAFRSGATPIEAEGS